MSCMVNIGCNNRYNGGLVTYFITCCVENRHRQRGITVVLCFYLTSKGKAHKVEQKTFLSHWGLGKEKNLS